MQLWEHRAVENPLCCICWVGWIPRPAGRISVRGNDLLDLKNEQLTIFRRRNIGFVFQNYNLVPILNVYENIVLRSSWMGKKLIGDL